MKLSHRYVCVYRKKHSLSRVRYYPSFQASTVGEGSLGPSPRGYGGGVGGAEGVLLYFTEWRFFPVGGSGFVIPASVLLFGLEWSYACLVT